MGMYDIFKASITSINPRIDSQSLTVKLLAGLGSGCLGAAVANPADLVCRFANCNTPLPNVVSLTLLAAGQSPVTSCRKPNHLSRAYFRHLSESGDSRVLPRCRTDNSQVSYQSNLHIPTETGSYTSPRRAGILTSSQLGSYDGTKTFFKREFPDKFPEGFRTHLICSGIAGFVCSATSAPGETHRHCLSFQPILNYCQLLFPTDSGHHQSASHER